MAVVYRAHDQHLDRTVAIKVLSTDLSDVAGGERFEREISVLARLVHPNIVALFDAGGADGHLYYVMPFVEGDTLRARLQKDVRLAPRTAADLGADVAEALAYAHGAGVVHRDVKPENIFIVAGRAILGDFGVAQVSKSGPNPDAATFAATPDVVVGTLAYISPEQASCEPDIDGRSDLYSLGCVLYELLAGQPPFVAPTAVGVLSKHLKQIPAPLIDRCPECPATLATLVMQLLEKTPGARAASATDVARALRAVADTDMRSAESASGASPAAAAAPRARRTRTPGIERFLPHARAAINHGASGGPTARRHLDEAEVYIDRALTLDPEDAETLALQGRLTWIRAIAGDNRESGFAAGRRYLLAALAADDEVAEVHATLAKMALYVDNDFHAAARSLRRAAELQPDDPETLRMQSVVAKILGQYDDAVAFARRSVALAQEIALFWNALGDVLLAGGRNSEAVDALKRAISLHPGYGPALDRMELARARLGEMDLAVEFRMSRLRVAGLSGRADALERDVARIGPGAARHADLERELEAQMDEATHTDPFADYFTSRNLGDRIIIAHAELGNWHGAMDWIERAYAQHPGRLRRVLTDLPFDRHGLAIEPRYARLLRVAGLEELLL